MSRLFGIYHICHYFPPIFVVTLPLVLLQEYKTLHSESRAFSEAQKKIYYPLNAKGKSQLKSYFQFLILNN